jgi:FtsP/CotA-like multicopper oxidase with cupredoxin domain
MRENEKPTLITRRQILASGIAMAGTIPFLPIARAAAVPEPRTAKLRLTAGTRALSVNGKPARVFGLIGPNGTPGITVAPGERFNVDLVNQAATSTIIHWHGQLPPWTQDGFPWSQTPPIPAGDTRSYDYAPIPGTYWMHSHHDLQEQSLMTAPLIVHSAAELREDRQEVVLMLHDFTFRTPEEVLAGLTGTSVAAAQAMAQKTEEASAEKGDANVPEPRIVGMAARVPRMAMPGMTMSGPDGMQMHLDLNDVHYDAFLANDRTLADPQIVRVERGGHIRLRVINGASSSQFWIDLGDLVGRVVATDGHPVHPVAGNRFPLAMAHASTS